MSLKKLSCHVLFAILNLYLRTEKGWNKKRQFSVPYLAHFSGLQKCKKNILEIGTN